MQMIGPMRYSFSRVLSLLARPKTCAVARFVARGLAESTRTTASTCRRAELAPPRHPHPVILAMTGGCAVAATAVSAGRPQCMKPKTCYDAADLWDQVKNKDASGKRRALMVFWRNEPKCGTVWMQEFFREFAPELQCVTKLVDEQKSRMWQLVDEEFKRLPLTPDELAQMGGVPPPPQRGWNNSPNAVNLNVNDQHTRAPSPLIPPQHQGGSQHPIVTAVAHSGGGGIGGQLPMVMAVAHRGGDGIGGGIVQASKKANTTSSTDDRLMRMMMVLNDDDKIVQDFVDQCLTGAVGINEMVPPPNPHTHTIHSRLPPRTYAPSIASRRARRQDESARPAPSGRRMARATIASSTRPRRTATRGRMIRRWGSTRSIRPRLP